MHCALSLSCAGKTTLADALQARLAHTIVLHQDDYFKDYENIPMREGTAEKDFDCVGAFDDAALRKQTEELQRHPERSCPTCAQSATEHQARDAPAVLLTRGARPVHVVLCEGLIVMHPDFQLSDSFDLCINLDLPQDTARARRKCRDYGEHPDPADYFDSVVWPRYIDYHKIIAEHPGLLSFHGDAPREQIVDAVIDEIKKIV
ncbi:hypothetical protein, variant [Capsaspora owczarzaki ATCC 30864]|uniref:Phosphoribulokinase/uridine kinase domain-containing protein n=1 Tax=Capsaspora owczarzaki (strain ATCC 30864) TaxID=595528 RepID=A0A0D2UHZ1_CAPO3|nr:hypothetical protein, variant [Capsaspora owczarzaki ATCC 30864]KJE94726.1 hypothetical protein, variant 1 [Capsaspora owczarzaki ATCC 30864]|eukprot:XP_011270495.1 hypothetical protein, variant [Capsaspora owczarzaki ATCC 30864]